MKNIKEKRAERKAERLEKKKRESLVNKAATLERQRLDRRKRCRLARGAVGDTLQAGNAPSTEAGWKRLKFVKGWNVWWQSNNDEWVNVKVVRAGKVLGKANYWLGYCPGEGRWANSPDWRAFKAQRADLWPRVRDLVESITWVRKD